MPSKAILAVTPDCINWLDFANEIKWNNCQENIIIYNCPHCSTLSVSLLKTLKKTALKKKHLIKIVERLITFLNFMFMRGFYI